MINKCQSIKIIVTGVSVDVLWWYIASLDLPGTASKRFKHSPKVAELVLVSPHGNAGEERFLSIVRKN